MPPTLGSIAQDLLSKDEVVAFVETLRKQYRINQRSASSQKERITRTGFTLDEQVLTVETALRMMGFDSNFARVVLFCAHGSTSENNPFESALDCGACGGNEGHPNARVLATMANNPKVRERLARRASRFPRIPIFSPVRSIRRLTTYVSSISKTCRRLIERMSRDSWMTSGRLLNSRVRNDLYGFRK